MGVMRSIGGGFRWAFKPFFEISQWFNTNALKNYARNIKDDAADLLVVKKTERSESFAEAMQRLGFTEQDIIDKQKSLLRLTLILVAIGLLVLAYALYLWWQDFILSGTLSFVLGLVAFAFAFRYHFWFFQVKHRLLGCSFKDWLHGKAGGE